MDRALQRGERLIEITPLRLNHPEQPVGRGEMRIQLNGVVALFERHLEIAAIVMNHRDVSRDDGRHGIEGLREQNLIERLVEAAERSGNIRITFSGRYRVTEYKGEQGTRIQHEVRADEVSVSLRGQSVAVERSARADERETDTY